MPEEEAATENHAVPTKKQLLLHEYTAEELAQLNHYELLHLEPHATADQIKKAFRKLSLKYHPDKKKQQQQSNSDETTSSTGDHIFLAIRQAHDTLMDESARQAYDSVSLDFDDSIPPTRAVMMETMLYTDDDFYSIFAPVFQRNLRFDARLRNSNNNSSSRKQSSSKTTTSSSSSPPSLGDPTTPLSQVHAFYEYWIHFESWRDFSDQAKQQLQIDQNFESRYEKRFFQKEIDKVNKQFKKQEMSRIQKLVQRAMDCDPRLRQEKMQMQQEKIRKKREKEQQQAQLLQRQREQETLQQQQLEQQQQEQLILKQQRIAQKKKIRKVKQAIKALCQQALEQQEQPSSSSSSCCYPDMYHVELRLEELWKPMQDDLPAFQRFLQQLEQTNLDVLLPYIRDKEIIIETSTATTTTSNNAANTTDASTDDGRNTNPITTTTTTTTNNNNNNSSSSKEWTQEELLTLRKALKKFPQAGGSRWDHIANYMNATLTPIIPYTKAMCIDKANNTSNSENWNQATQATTATTTTTTWSNEEDQWLQEGLRKYPASMDKNERWTAIAQCVPGKTKKECVQRFQSIRNALLQKK